MVIREADQARAKASQYRGELCSADHQRYLLHIVRGLLYVEDLIYANGQRFICSTSVHQQTGWRMPAANYTKKAGCRDLLLPGHAVLSGLCHELYAEGALCCGG